MRVQVGDKAGHPSRDGKWFAGEEGAQAGCRKAESALTTATPRPPTHRFFEEKSVTGLPAILLRRISKGMGGGKSFKTVSIRPEGYDSCPV